MRKSMVIQFLTLIFLPLLSSTLFLPAALASPKPVELYQVNEQIWVHTSYQIYNGYLTPSNGLVVVTKEGLIMVDTCWDNESTQELLTMAEKRFKQKFILALITHGAHEDRIGGIDALLARGIEVISTELTAQEALKAGYQQPVPKLDSMPKMTIGGVQIESYYPGPGHTKDNITVWFPAYKILFAGCIVKSLDSRNLGNLEDADLKAWPQSLKNILKQYPDTLTVIPGHGRWGGINLINHTLTLFRTNMSD